MAPRPVAYSITRRLEQHVLSIDDDDKLPAGLRNLQHGPSGPSEDGLSEFDTAFLCQPENTEALLRRDAPKSDPMARTTELRRPRLIARMDSTRQEKKNVPTYAPPKNIDFQKSSSSRGRSPYPADTLTELEYRGIIRAKPKLNSSDADSRSITKPEQDVWKSTKSRIGYAKEDMLAKLGIKTKRVRDAEKRGYTPLTRHAKASIPSSEHPGISTVQRRGIEQWRSRASGEDGGESGHPDTEAEEPRNEAHGNRANMTTAEGHAAAHPGVRNRFSNLKVRAFRSKPELRAKM
ncbi:hypothetical protein IMZ48_08250 [Candidatus Bathyarchaeota archaeon]|nr:hypothetical protein [Candidatus Bathyarchaeota archaeon]